MAAQCGQPQDPLGCSTSLLAVSASPASALEAWGGQSQVFCVLRASPAQADLVRFAGSLTP